MGKDDAKKLLDLKKEESMNGLDKILDQFCKDVIGCCLYKGGTAFASNELYEWYAGKELGGTPSGILHIRDIVNNPKFKGWCIENCGQEFYDAFGKYLEE
ncbi:MAG: hypothetical protein V3V78_03510 [Candidatus Woesearchaeota archaeon]